MRAILESYDSELGSTEYSPQLSKRLKEAEDVLQRTQNHNVELEVRDPLSSPCFNPPYSSVFFSKLHLRGALTLGPFGVEAHFS